MLGQHGQQTTGGSEGGQEAERHREAKPGRGGSKKGKRLSGKSRSGRKSSESQASGKTETSKGGPGNVAPPPQLAASQAETLASLLGSPAASIQALDYYRIPMFLLPIYQSAAVQYGVPWEVLAAINEVETNYGNDLAVSTAGAIGWMQFMPETWLQYGVDVQNAGYADPYNPVDAIFAAARYLKAAGASKDLKRAIFAYNHSNAYVESVLLRAKLIAHYPSNVIATLTGLAEARLPVAGALATGEVLIGGSGGGVEGAGEGSEGSAGGEAGPGGEGGTEEGASGEGPVAEAASSGAKSGSTVAPSPSESAAGVSRRRGPRRFVELSAPAGLPVVAVQDGKIIAKGVSRKLGRYLVLRDVYGDVFTYAGLRSIARTYSPPKLSGAGHVPGVVVAGASSAGDPSPTQAATEGSQPPVTLQPPATLKTKGAEPAGKGASAGASSSAGGSEPVGEAGAPLGKVRMFAHPHSSYARAAIARARAEGNLAGQRLALKVGSVVSQGTVIATTKSQPGGKRATLRFSVRPAGDSGTVAAQPVLQSWRQLYAALHPDGARRAAGLLGATAGDAFLLSGQALQRAVLSDPGIGLDTCMRQDISIGAIDDRVLATLVFLSRSGLKPTVGSLPCARRVKGGFSIPGAGVRGPVDSLQITAVNGIAIAGHQGPGSIADLTVRTLLTLQGRFAPREISSLMHYPGSPSTLASSRRSGSILVLFPRYSAQVASSGAASAGNAAGAEGSGVSGSAQTQGTSSTSAALGAGQWSALLNRVGAIIQPQVSRRRSSAAIPDRTPSTGSQHATQTGSGTGTQAGSGTGTQTGSAAKGEAQGAGG